MHASHLPGSGFAYAAVLAGVFVTALYSFRLFFMVFHGKERMDEHTREHLHESPAVVTVPLVLLAIPSVLAGYLIGPVLFGGYFGDAIVVAPEHDVLGHLAEEWHGPLSFILHGVTAPPFFLAMAGLGLAAWIYLKNPSFADWAASTFRPVYRILVNKYGFDDFNERVLAGGGRGVGKLLWRVGDVILIDGLVVNGSARAVGWMAARARNIQTGYLYHYAFAMILGLLALISWMLFFR